MNTLLIQPEDIESLKNYLGYGFLFIALINVIVLILKIQKIPEKAKNNKLMFVGFFSSGNSIFEFFIRIIRSKNKI